MIPYPRTVNFLSPSALAQFERNPIDFYFRRLGPPEDAPPREEQSFPAACGIAFDAMVKNRLAQELKLRCPSLEFMLNEVRTERPRVLALAENLLKGYASSGALGKLLDERPTGVAVDGEDFAPGTRVPVRTRIDAVTTFGDRMTIHDWKVLGSGRPGTASPSQGYNLCWDTDQPLVPNAAHSKAGAKLEELDEEWATQITMYGWAMGLSISNTVYGSIDQVIAWHGDRVRVAQFRAPISVEFQLGVRDRLVEAWRKINDRDVVPQGLTLEQLRVML